MTSQARRQEMKWGVFCKKVENVGVFFCKKVDLSSTQGALCTVPVYFYFTFYLFAGAYAPNAPPLPTGLFHSTHRQRYGTREFVLIHTYGLCVWQSSH